MPAKTRKKTTASRTRSRTGGRAKGHQPPRRRRAAAAATDAIIADSLFTVRLQEKPGTEVFCNLEKVKAEEFDQMYNDLWKAWANMRYITCGEKRIDASSLGASKAATLHFILEDFKQLLPSDFKFNIEWCTSSGQFYFMAYKECQWNVYWHYLAICTVVQKLKKENRRLHDLFLSFLRVLSRAGIDLWYENSMEWSLEYMNERITEEGAWDPDDLEVYKECIAKYAKGLPANYKSLIEAAKLIKPADLKKRANRFKSHPIANLIYQGAELLMDGDNFYDYMYMPGGEDEAGGCYLELNQQANIIWEEHDCLYDDHCDTIDSVANEGVQEPVLSFRIDAGTRKIDFAELNKKSHWPYKLSQWFDRANDEINKYTNERKD